MKSVTGLPLWIVDRDREILTALRPAGHPASRAFGAGFNSARRVQSYMVNYRAYFRPDNPAGMGALFPRDIHIRRWRDFPLRGQSPENRGPGKRRQVFDLPERQNDPL